MAKVIVNEFKVSDAVVRAELKRAANGTGIDYERTVSGQITRRTLPLLDTIENAMGTPIETTVEKSRGKQSAQYKARCQWQRAHRRGWDERRPEATIEFIVPGGKVGHVYLLEISLQTDLVRLGLSRDCRLSQAKASQLAGTAFLASEKYPGIPVDYWYLCPWWPTPDTVTELLTPMQKMHGSDDITLTWTVLDHGP